MKFEIDVLALPPLPLRYYKGWSIVFDIRTETFQSPLLCLFNFSSVRDLETAMDFAILQRNK